MITDAAVDYGYANSRSLKAVAVGDIASYGLLESIGT